LTELQTMYANFRDAGCSHREAIDRLSAKLQVDYATVARVLHRAKLPAGTSVARSGGRR